MFDLHTYTSAMSAAVEAEHITSPIDPDPRSVRKFIADMISKGLFTILIASIVKLIESFHAINAELNRKLAAASRKRPRSEALRRLQLELSFVAKPANDTGDPKGDAPAEKPKTERKKKGPKTPTAHGRPRLPEHLLRVPVKLLVPAESRACPVCAVTAEHVGFKCTEKLDLVPARWVVQKIMRETVASGCEHAYIFTAPKSDEVLDRGILGNGLLVEALVEHYDEAVPWERMERKAKAEGVPLAANTLAPSVWRAIDLFDPILRHITHKCLTSGYTALDATGMPVIDPEHPLGIRSGALWLVEGDHKYALFAYAPTGHAAHIEKLFEGYRLASVMCDGSATNNCVERAGGSRGGCNAHARRGLVDALRRGDTRALEGIEIFASIFHVDALSKIASESVDERFARRQRESAPWVAKLRAWVDARRADVEPKTALGRALRYMHLQWKRLTAFMRDPQMDLTNNEVERDLRRWVLDRKTWFFCGHDDSARRAADALTIITTCRKHGIDPRRYLRETLAKILAGEKDLTALLPETFAAAQTPAKAAA
jgi:transposase